MGRKKKITKTVSGIQNVSYQGIVDLSITHGDKLVVKKQYHNSGMPELFRFLANCLGGNISTSLRPVKIRLFKYAEADLPEGPTPGNFEWTNLHNSNKLEAVSPFISYDATPVISRIDPDDNKDHGYYTVSFHFNIPIGYISSDRIHVAGFYPNNVTNNFMASAYYLFIKKDDDNQEIWDPIVLTSASGDYNIIINWTLTIKNA